MPVRLSAAVSVAVLLSAAGSAMGQVAGSAAQGAAARAPLPAASAASSPAAPSQPGYRSVFDGYRSFSDQAVLPWREANDLVGRIGGWQAYAREGQGDAAGGTGEKPADKSNRTPSPAAPAASSAGAHSGHKTP